MTALFKKNIRCLIKCFMYILCPINIALSGNPEDARGTGYIPSDSKYPNQPVLIVEIQGINVLTTSGQKFFPLNKICEALGYTVNLDSYTITISKDGKAHSVDIDNNAGLLMEHGVIYVSSSLFNEMLGISFRYLKGIGLLSIFK